MEDRPRCSKCNSLTRPHAKFCGKCGEAVGVSCPECDVVNRVDDFYCYDCGSRLYPPPWELDRSGEGDKGDSSSARTAATVTAPAAYVGPLLCQRCRTANEPGSAYCYQCGLPLEEMTAYETSTSALPQAVLRASDFYHSSRARANWTIGLIILVCLVHVWYIFELNAQLNLVTDIEDGRAVGADTLAESEEDILGVATILFIFYLASAIVFLMWLYRVSRNL